MKRPVIVAISGFSSEVGKTTLMCDLLRAFPGLEGIKVSRGHYRSCGMDPKAWWAMYLSNITEQGTDERNKFARWRKESGMDKLIGDLPIYTREDLPELIARVQKIDVSAHLATGLAAATGQNSFLPS